MTSINALRLNQHSGLLVCDEARFWNDEWMIILTPDKIRTAIAPTVTKRTGVILYLGSTGTSSYGDEIMESIRQFVSQRFSEVKEKDGIIPEEIATVENIAHAAFNIVKDLHRVHIDDYLRGHYGFVGQELVQGFKMKNNQQFDLVEEKILEKAVKHMSCEGVQPELSGLLNNAQVLAGYDPCDGFRIFFMEQKNPVLEEVSDIYLAEGSGTITCDLTYSGFSAARPVKKRRHDIDRVQALITMLEGVEEAHRLVAGVRGYPKIIYIDGRHSDPDQKVQEISDCRSWLATEITMAGANGYVPTETVYSLIDQLIFQHVPFHSVNEQFMAYDTNNGLFRFLRGFRTERAQEEFQAKTGEQS